MGMKKRKPRHRDESSYVCDSCGEEIVLPINGL